MKNTGIFEADYWGDATYDTTQYGYRKFAGCSYAFSEILETNTRFASTEGAAKRIPAGLTPGFRYRFSGSCERGCLTSLRLLGKVGKAGMRPTPLDFIDLQLQTGRRSLMDQNREEAASRKASIPNTVNALTKALHAAGIRFSFTDAYKVVRISAAGKADILLSLKLRTDNRSRPICYFKVVGKPGWHEMLRQDFLPRVQKAYFPEAMAEHLDRRS